MTNAEQTQGQVPAQKPKQLYEFVEENQKLITVLGVFSALTVFAGNLPYTFGQILSFVFLSNSVLIWLELWSRFPGKGGAWRLKFFENFTSLGILGIAGYWFFQAQPKFPILLTIAVWFVSITVISNLIARYELFNRIFKTVPDGRKGLRITLGIILMLAALALSILIAGFAGPPLDDWARRVAPDVLKKVP